MKLCALIAATLMAAGTTAHAYDTDDWGFPVEGSYSATLTSSSNSVRGISRPSRLFRNVLPSFARVAPAQPAAQVARVVASRPIQVVTSRPVQAPAAAPAVAQAAPAQPTAARPAAISLRPVATQSR